MNKTHATMESALSELMAIRALGPLDAGEVAFSGADPFHKTPFRMGETMAAALAARGVAANDLWALRAGERQTIHVDASAAAAAALGGEITQRRDEDGVYRTIPGSAAMAHMVALTRPWPTADGRWFLPHTNLPHLERRVLDVLRCDSTPDSVARAIAAREAQELEDSIAAAGACGGMVRSYEQWLAHPHGAYLASRPVVEISRIGESAPEPLPPGDQPLSGLRVLDCTRILAGPTCGLSLAEHGADVLMATAPHLPQVPEFVRDTSHGKRSCFLDFTRADEAETLRALIRGADVVIDGYRPDALKAHGFGVDDISMLRPGIVHVSVNCFGSGGPFAKRAGWDQVAQAVTGMCHVQGLAAQAGGPQLTPVYMVDFLTGFLGAFGAMLALARRAREGGSYRVQVSLCQSAMLLQRQGQVEDFSSAPGHLDAETFERLSREVDSPVYGRLKTLGPALTMSRTPCLWACPTPRLGGDRPEWLSAPAPSRKLQNC